MYTTYESSIPSALDLPCPAWDTNTQDKTMLRSVSGVESWGACGALCGERADCEHWSWHDTTKGDFALVCHLLSAAGRTSSDAGIVSGHRSCVGQMLKF